MSNQSSRFELRKSISLLLVDDDQLVRSGIRLLIEKISDINIVGEASNGRDALVCVENLHPNIVLTDISMPILNGIDLASQIRRRHSEIGVVILTASTDEEHLMKAVDAGAAGYLLKDSSVAELEIAIRAVSQGQAYVTPRMTKPLLSEHIVWPDTAINPLSRLTPRHREVLQLIVEGRTNKEIALSLRITAKTVEKHRTELMQRLNVHNSAALVRCALQNGFL